MNDLVIAVSWVHVRSLLGRQQKAGEPLDCDPALALTQGAAEGRRIEQEGFSVQ